MACKVRSIDYLTPYRKRSLTPGLKERCAETDLALLGVQYRGVAATKH